MQTGGETVGWLYLYPVALAGSDRRCPLPNNYAFSIQTPTHPETSSSRSKNGIRTMRASLRCYGRSRRLRAVVLQADQLQRSLSGVGGGAGAVLELLRGQLKDEPCVKESPRLDMGK
jgi:hypothetical protein